MVPCLEQPYAGFKHKLCQLCKTPSKTDIRSPRCGISHQSALPQCSPASVIIFAYPHDLLPSSLPPLRLILQIVDMSAGRPPGTKNKPGHKAGGAREGSGKKNTQLPAHILQTEFRNLSTGIVMPGKH